MCILIYAIESKRNLGIDDKYINPAINIFIKEENPSLKHFILFALGFRIVEKDAIYH